jgi:sigma-B regulation protein RsbU (phosphoserine phosphatase)
MNPKKTSQPALGLMEKSQYETGELQLAPRDMMLLFTDGVYEVQSKNGQLYSKEMLQAVVAKHIKKSCKSLFDLLFKEVQDFAANNEFDDDVCMVGMEFTGSNTTK